MLTALHLVIYITNCTTPQQKGIAKAVTIIDGQITSEESINNIELLFQLQS